jgi:hypothetical protein
VIFELIKQRSVRDNLWVQLNGTNQYRQIGGTDVVRAQNTSVAGWDDRIIFDQRIRNDTSKPIDVEIRRTHPGHVVFRSQLEPKLFDYQTAQFQSRVAAGEKKDLRYELVQHNGYNDKHQGMSLATAIQP